MSSIDSLHPDDRQKHDKKLLAAQLDLLDAVAMAIKHGAADKAEHYAEAYRALTVANS